MHKNIILRQNKFISSRTALAFFCSKTFWNLGISDGFPEEIFAAPLPFCPIRGYLILASLHVRRSWQARVHCALLQKPWAWPIIGAGNPPLPLWEKKGVCQMPDKDKEKKKEKAKGKVPGQGKTADAALNVYWSDDRRFAEVFGKEVFNGEPLDPKQLSDASNVESTMIKIKDGPAFTLKQTRDVVKSLKDGTLLTIVGIENQTEIDYSMPFRVKELDFINAARQVYDIKAGNHAERDPDDPLTFGETISNYYKDDRIAPVFTLVIYYGKEEWTFPLSMADMYIDSPYKKFVERGAMHLLDVRHMDDEKLDGYSDELKAFLGYLRCANAAQQREWI